jgi:ribonuclease HII
MKEMIIYKMLSLKYNPENKFEIGIDEAGRGPLFGRLYVAAVVLPEDPSLFHNPQIKDSKKIKNKKKMNELSDYIKEHSLAWAIHSIEHDVIDKINIRQAVFQGMHECIKQIIETLGINPNLIDNKTFLLVDGNDFKPYSVFDNDTETLFTIPHETIEGGDNKYVAIAAASILAKCARDNYIHELCEEYPVLSDHYKINSNMGYGTKAHLEGILNHGITQWHRVSYARCKGSPYNPI